MYENLNRLVMTGEVDETNRSQMNEMQGLLAWTVETAGYIKEHGPLPDATSFAVGLSAGFQFGVAYAREFGIPDLSKNLVTLKEEVER